MFDLYEIGQVSSQHVRDSFRALFHIGHITDQEFDRAMNKLFIKLPPEKLEMVKKLKDAGYKTFVLSNFNEILHKGLFEICKRDCGRDDFEGYFDKEYYSFQTGFRKPNKDSFENLLKKSNLIPHETLFIDDDIKNVEAAREPGIRAVHLGSELKTVFDLPKMMEEKLNSGSVI